MKYISNTLTTAIGIAGALMIVLAVSLTMQQPGRSALDQRTTIRLPADGRAAVLEEMRTMMWSVSGLLTGSVDGDVAAMRSAARASGLAGAVDVQPEIQRRLPKEFLALGEGTHAAFDSIDAVLARWPVRDSALARLARISGACVACHATYRVEAE